VAHAVLDRCVLCARPRCDASDPRWTSFGARSVRCPTCGRDAVTTQQDARQRIPLVRREMAALGIRLRVPVRVTITDPDALAGSWARADGVVFGLTHQRIPVDGGPVDVLGIRVAAGLTPTHFGATLAHELGHAWLAEQGVTDLALSVEEGMCQLFAGAWLKKQRTTLAAALRAGLPHHPVPEYGLGYQAARAAVLRHGIGRVLASVRDLGCLPAVD
jgi:hypothetical protein